MSSSSGERSVGMHVGKYSGLRINLFIQRKIKEQFTMQQFLQNTLPHLDEKQLLFKDIAIQIFEFHTVHALIHLLLRT